MDYNLLNLRLRIITHNQKFDNFLERHCSLLPDNSENGSPNIYVNLNPSNFEISNNLVQISRNIKFGDSNVFISAIERFPGLKINVRMDKNRLYVDAFLQDKNQSFIKKLFLLLRSKDKYREGQFVGLHYYLILIPFFYYLEYFNGLFLLHASAIEFNGKGILLSGLGGIGKSTFSLGTLHLKGTKFISDNLIFYNDKKIYSCPEPIALDNKSIEIISGVKKCLIPADIKYSHNRIWYHVKPEVTVIETIPKYLFWLQWGNENKIIPIDKESCIKNLYQINLLAKEVREYYILAAAMNLAFPSPKSLNDFNNILSSLLSKVDCYILQFKPGADIKTVINETIAKIIA